MTPTTVKLIVGVLNLFKLMASMDKLTSTMISANICPSILRKKDLYSLIISFAQ